MSLPVPGDNSLVEPAKSPMAMNFPSGAQATERMLDSSRIVRFFLPVAASQK